MRTFDAPPELVWHAWTDRDAIVKWWGPIGFTTTTSEMDVSPGGIWRFVMHGPDGTDYPNKIVYTDVVRPSRLAYDHFADPSTELHFQATIDLRDLGGKTELTMRMDFASPEIRDQIGREYGVIEGLSQTIGRLAEFVDMS